jgi:hypothetical protein
MRIELYANVDSVGKILLHTVCLMVFNATFNNISVTSISWRSVFFIEETGETIDLSQVTDKLDHIMLYTSPRSRFEHNISGDRH